MDIRSNIDGGIVAPGVNATPAFGSLIIGGGTAFASASNPSAEVIDGTGVAAGASFGTTVDATAGTVTIVRPGRYKVGLTLSDYSSGTASGNVQFDVQVNGAAAASRLQAIRVAATAKDGLVLGPKVLTLAKGDVIRAVVTSAAGTVQTVTEGILLVEQVADNLTGKVA
jgi:hypothetical protein